jgi:hypothetical protein
MKQLYVISSFVIGWVGKSSRCKLEWLKNIKSLSPKIPYFNIKIEKTIKNQFWVGLMWWLIN